MSDVAEPLTPPGLAGTRVAVVGAGYMGLGIAQVLATAGAEIALHDDGPDVTRRALDRLHDQVRGYEEAGLARPGVAADVARLVRAGGSLGEALHGVDLVIEAVPESRSTKAAVWEALDRAAPTSALLASNTSSIPIAEIAVSLRQPARLVGMHWFNPAPFVPGVEVIPGPGTPAETVDRVATLARRAGKTATVVADSPGFVANRLQFALFREAAAIVEEGVAGAADVDAVVRSTFGFRLPFFGPFAIADMAGLDVYRGSFEVLESTLGRRFTPPPALLRLTEQGHLGDKTGSGFLALEPDGIAARAHARDTWYQALERLLAALAVTP